MLVLRVSQNSRHWDPHGDDDTLRRYGHPLHAMAQAVLLALEDHDSGYKFPLTDTTRAAAETLLRELEKTENDEMAISALHQLAYQLLSYQDTSEELSKWECVLECFTAVYFLQRDGTFADADQTTQYFAICKYLCRAVTLHEALAHAQQHKKQPYKYVPS
jgi:hypothetical protein